MRLAFALAVAFAFARSTAAAPAASPVPAKRDFAGKDKGFGSRMLRNARHRVAMQQEFFKRGLGKMRVRPGQHGNLQPSACHEVTTDEEARYDSWPGSTTMRSSLLQSFADPAYIEPIIGQAVADPACIHPKRAPSRRCPA